MSRTSRIQRLRHHVVSPRHVESSADSRELGMAAHLGAPLGTTPKQEWAEHGAQPAGCVQRRSPRADLYPFSSPREQAVMLPLGTGFRRLLQLHRLFVRLSMP